MYSIIKLILAATLGAAAATLAQERRLARAHYDDAFGMLTRAGLEARLDRMTSAVDVLFCDLDHIHDLNARLGYTEVNALIRSAFQLRRGDAILIGRYFSGDEIILVAPAGDGRGLAERLQLRLGAVGLSATIAVASATPRSAIRQASEQVRLAKTADQRGCVVGGA
jgi:GGDEF domain-containing protein